MFKMLQRLLRGFKITFSHIFKKKATVQYPEEPVAQARRFRGRHYLRLWDDGLERCIGCHLCSAACPADAIFVLAEDNPGDKPISHGERYAKEYKIDWLRCIFCGYCEDACPTYAIVLAPGFEMAGYSREEFIADRDRLMEPEPNWVENKLGKEIPGDSKLYLDFGLTDAGGINPAKLD